MRPLRAFAIYLTGLSMALGIALLGACTGTSQEPRVPDQGQPERPTLLLISLDGFRWDFMEL
ncbi:MAG: hypothetical protein WBO54_09940, partial [Thermoanaerobaculia bacterium]